MQTLAITGATGFLGKQLVSECIAQNRFKLRLLTRDRNALSFLSNDKVTICEGDLLKPESLKGFLLPNSTLIHLAYIKNAGNINFEAISNLIKTVKRVGVKRVIHCSTAVVIGFQAKGVITEKTKSMPRGEYQQTKYQIEEMLRAKLLPDVELAILRPTEIIGPGGLGLHSMIERLQRRRDNLNFIYHFIFKHRRFNYVSVYNVVEALLLLAALPIVQLGEIYNISDDDDVENNYSAVEQIINKCLNLKQTYPFDVGFPRAFLSLAFRLLPTIAPPDRIYSHSKILSLGYRKKINLHSAILEIGRF